MQVEHKLEVEEHPCLMEEEELVEGVLIQKELMNIDKRIDKTEMLEPSGHFFDKDSSKNFQGEPNKEWKSIQKAKQ